MKKLKKIFAIATVVLTSSFVPSKSNSISLTVSVTGLKNSKGHIQYSLYNKEGTIPDEQFKNHFKQLNSEILDNSSTVTFNNLPEGVYAVNILHDENQDGIIDKGWILPVEGIGFSNLKSINPLNRPSFKECKFELNTNKNIEIKIIYM